MTIVRWLHLSDIHMRASVDFEASVVLREFLKDVTARRSRVDEQFQTIDFVAITGDIAFSGKQGEYEKFRERLLLPLWEALGARTQTFIVPGNHDVDRELVTPASSAVIDSLSSRSRVTSLLLHEGDRSVVLRRLSAFQEFFAETFPEIVVDETSGCYAVTLEKGDAKVKVVGLNSAWSAVGGADDRGRLVFGAIQVERTSADTASDEDLTIALFHHPLDWCREIDDTHDVRRNLQGLADVILSGHLHAPNVISESGLSGSLLRIPAGALYETREWPNSYNYVSIDLETSRGQVHLRRYDAIANRWHADVAATRSTEDGVVTFQLPSRVPDEPASSIRKRAPPSTPSIVPRLGEVVTLVGDQRHGFFSELVRGSGDRLASFAASGVPCTPTVLSHDDQPWVESQLLRGFIDRGIGGLIIAPAGGTESLRLLEELSARGVPVVQVDRRLPGLPVPWVGIDNAGAAQAAVSHLIERHGARRVAVVGGRAHVSTNEDRVRGYHASLKAGPSQWESVTWNCSAWEPARAEVSRMLSADEGPDSFFCLSGLATLGAVLAFRDDPRGERLPIIGFDDPPWTLLNEPPLSVIRQPAAEIGATAANLILDIAMGEEVQTEAVLPYEFVIRGSCGCGRREA